MSDIGFQLITLCGVACIFYLIGKGDGLTVGRVKCNELVRDTARTLENTLDMLNNPAVRPPEVRGYLMRNVRRLKDGEKLE